MPPKESISLMSFASIRTLIVSSESLAVKYKPSLFNSNLIPFKTGITFLVDIALITLFNPSKIIFFMYHTKSNSI